MFVFSASVFLRAMWRYCIVATIWLRCLWAIMIHVNLTNFPRVYNWCFDIKTPNKLWLIGVFILIKLKLGLLQDHGILQLLIPIINLWFKLLSYSSFYLIFGLDIIIMQIFIRFLSIFVFVYFGTIIEIYIFYRWALKLDLVVFIRAISTLLTRNLSVSFTIVILIWYCDF